MNSTTHPRISIALPVHNGENYLRLALESVAAQTFEDYEVIILDNASTDGTSAICKEFAERDPRIRYVRNEINIGINPNFDRGVELANGTYFCWLAHDDEYTPEYLSTCAKVLNRCPDVVLVHSLVQIIDTSGAVMSVYDSALHGSDSDRQSERFRALTHIRHTCTAMFGLHRLAALRKTRIMAPNHHAVDRSMLAELSLIGKIVQIDEPLFRNREHSNRYVRKIRPSERSAFHQRGDRRQIEVSQRLLVRDYRKAIETHVSDPSEYKRCQSVLRAWWLREWNCVRLLVELSARRAPWVYDWAKWVSDRIVQPKHPTITRDKPTR